MKTNLFALFGIFLVIQVAHIDGKKDTDIDFLDDEADLGSGIHRRNEEKRISSRIDDEDEGEGSGSGHGPNFHIDHELPASVATTPTTTTTTTERSPSEYFDKDPKEDVDEEDDDYYDEDDEDDEEYDDSEDGIDEEEEEEDNTRVFVPPPPETPVQTTSRSVEPDIQEESGEDGDDEEEDDDYDSFEPVDITEEEVFPDLGVRHKSSEEDDMDKNLVPVDPAREVPSVESQPPGNMPDGKELGNDVYIYGTPKDDTTTSFFSQPGVLAAHLGKMTSLSGKVFQRHQLSFKRYFHKRNNFHLAVSDFAKYPMQSTMLAQHRLSNIARAQNSDLYTAMVEPRGSILLANCV